MLRTQNGVREYTGPAYYARNHLEPVWGWHAFPLRSLEGTGLGNALIEQGVWNRVLGYGLRYDRSARQLLHSIYFGAGRVSSSGARGLNESVQKFELREDRMLVCKTNNLCLQASLANAIALAADEEYAQEVMFKAALPSMLSSTHAERWCNDYEKPVVLQRVHIPKGTELAWLLKQTAGVYLVRLYGRNVDHVISVSSELRQVLDPVEQFPVRLWEECIRECAGNARFFEKILEIR
ncbi:hypothetical protein FGB62_196g06 [Gracilaria domingensis]|nr:hypothetical protein FGB62_196g06 [Gracilaria domingensis]